MYCSMPCVAKGWLRRRRLLDRPAAALLLLMVGPLLAAAGAVTWLADGRPAFVRVNRVGRGGREFGMWKVRTMRSAAPSGLAHGPSLAALGDVRVTRLGRILRSFRLDELPQLLNVLGGQMSLLGPRPEAPEYVTDSPIWARVLAVEPGVAGPTQVLTHDWELEQLAAGGAAIYLEEVLPLKLEVDEWYISNASLPLDVVVGLAVIQRLVLRQQRTALHRWIEHRTPTLSSRPWFRHCATTRLRDA